MLYALAETALAPAELRQLRRSLRAARALAARASRAGGETVVCRIIETSPAADH